MYVHVDGSIAILGDTKDDITLSYYQNDPGNQNQSQARNLSLPLQQTAQEQCTKQGN